MTSLSYFFTLMHPPIPIVFYVTALFFVIVVANMASFLRDMVDAHNADYDFVNIAEHMELGIEVETELNIH